MVQWLRSVLLLQGEQIRSLVRDLRFHMLHGMDKKKKTKEREREYTFSIFFHHFPTSVENGTNIVTGSKFVLLAS